MSLLDFILWAQHYGKDNTFTWNVSHQDQIIFTAKSHFWWRRVIRKLHVVRLIYVPAYLEEEKKKTHTHPPSHARRWDEFLQIAFSVILRAKCCILKRQRSGLSPWRPTT